MQEPVELKSIVYDNTSGAREIAARSLQLLQRTATQSTADTSGRLLDELADTIVKVVRSKPEMGVVFSCLNRVLRDFEQHEATTEVGELRMHAVSGLQEQVRRMEADVQAAAEATAALIKNGDMVLTYSRSSTVLAALRRAKSLGKTFDVVTAESRPNLEGRTLARELAEDQIPVRFVVDALLGTVVEGADRILVGADAITPKTVVNKIGTRLLAMAAKARGIPCHVVATTDKAWLKRAEPSLSLLSGKHRDPKEVWDPAPFGVEVVNLYFEQTPVELFDGIISELGLGSMEAFWGSVRERGFARRLQDAFGGELG